jgi:hypothetical protein
MIAFTNNLNGFASSLEGTMPSNLDLAGNAFYLQLIIREEFYASRRKVALRKTNAGKAVLRLKPGETGSFSGGNPSEKRFICFIQTFQDILKRLGMNAGRLIRKYFLYFKQLRCLRII